VVGICGETWKKITFIVVPFHECVRENEHNDQAEDRNYRYVYKRPRQNVSIPSSTHFYVLRIRFIENRYGHLHY
jgi:hypothetical protein